MHGKYLYYMEYCYFSLEQWNSILCVHFFCVWLTINCLNEAIHILNSADPETLFCINRRTKIVDPTEHIYLLPIFTMYYSIYKMKKNLRAKKLFNWFAFTDLLSFLIPSFIYKLYFYSPFAFMKKTSWTQTKTWITFHCTKSF